MSATKSGSVRKSTARTALQIVLAVSESASYTSLFKKNTKMNISSFINHKRILRAMQLISTTSIPLIEISAQVGYNSRQHFARNFKTFANCSPQEYRNRISSNDLKNYSKNDLYKTERIFID